MCESLFLLDRGTEELCHREGIRRGQKNCGGTERESEQMRLLVRAELRHVSQMLTSLRSKIVVCESLMIESVQNAKDFGLLLEHQIHGDWKSRSFLFAFLISLNMLVVK